MLPILVFLCSVFGLITVVSSAPIPGRISPLLLADPLDRFLPHRLMIAEENMRCSCLQTQSHSSDNGSDATGGGDSETETTAAAAAGDIKAPDLVLQIQGKAIVTRPQDTRAWEKRFTEKEAWDAASWIWG